MAKHTITVDCDCEPQLRAARKRLEAAIEEIHTLYRCVGELTERVCQLETDQYGSHG